MADAQLLEQRRKEAKKSKTALAKALHVTRPTLYKILKNPERATFEQACIICKEISISKESEREHIFFSPMLP